MGEAKAAEEEELRADMDRVPEEDEDMNEESEDEEEDDDSEEEDDALLDSDVSERNYHFSQREDEADEAA